MPKRYFLGRFTKVGDKSVGERVERFSLGVAPLKRMGEFLAQEKFSRLNLSFVELMPRGSDEM